MVRSAVRWSEAAIRTAWDDPDKITMEIVSGYKKPLQADNWDRALWELVVASHPLGLETQLEEITVPVLVITGEGDRVVPSEQSVRLEAGLPNSELVVIPACGHVPHEECPDAFLSAVTDFVGDLP